MAAGGCGSWAAWKRCPKLARPRPRCLPASRSRPRCRRSPINKPESTLLDPHPQSRGGPDADAATAHVGEIGQPEPSRRVLLPEDDGLLGAMQRPPGANAPFQGTPNAGPELGMTAADLIENGDRPQAGGAFQQRHHLAIPNRGKRISPAADARRLLLRGKPGILLDAISGGGAEPGLRRGDDRRFDLAKPHI